MFFLLYRQKDINKIIEGNYRNYVIDKLTQAYQLSSFCLFHVACMYTSEEEPANKLLLCWFLNTAARLSPVDQFISFIWSVHRSRVGT